MAQRRSDRWSVRRGGYGRLSRAACLTGLGSPTGCIDMPAFDFPSRVTRLAAMLSLLLFGLCIGAAFYLYHQQAITAENLGENIGSRRAARDLKAVLEKLVGALADGNLKVADLNQ